jgi:hypothetical protein
MRGVAAWLRLATTPTHPDCCAIRPLPAQRGEENRLSFSRRVFAPELWNATVTTLSDSSPPNLIRWSMQTCRRQTLGGKRSMCFTAAWMPGAFKLKTALRAFCPGMTKERTKKDSEAKRRQTQGSSAAPDGHGRCPHPNPPPACGGGNGRGQHIYRRSTAALVPRSLSSQGTQHQAFASWDAASLLSGRYPPLPIPVQRSIAPRS